MNQSIHADKLLNAQDIKEYIAEYNQLFIELYNKMVVRVKHKLDDVQHICDFIVEALVLLKENADMLHGPEKKQLAIDLVTSIVDTMTISDEDKAQLKAHVFPTLGYTIDLLIAVAKGYLFLQKVEDKVEEECAKCSAKCGGFKCAGCKKNKSKKHSRGLRDGEPTVEAPQTPDGVTDVTALSNQVYDDLRGMITNKQITAESIIGIVTLAMQLVQQFAGVKGADKKKIVINVVTRLVNEIPLDAGAKAAIQMVLNTTLDKTIDLIIGVANGDIDLVATVQNGVASCKQMCGCAPKQ